MSKSNAKENTLAGAKGKVLVLGRVFFVSPDSTPSAFLQVEHNELVIVVVKESPSLLSAGTLGVCLGGDLEFVTKF